MNRKNAILIPLIAGILFISACSEEEIPVGPYTYGPFDATTFVSVGNSLTAGYQSGALYRSAQMYSLGNLLAGHLGAADYAQPLMDDPGTGRLMVLTSLAPTIVTGDPNLAYPEDASTLARPYNNLGIPGALLFDGLDTSSIAAKAQPPPLGRSNPFFHLIMRDQGIFGKSMIDQAAALNPTLMTFWLGNNDYFGYAASGGTRGTNQGSEGNQPFTLPTEPSLFRTLYQVSLTKISVLLPDTKVLVANFPDPTSTPLYTTIPIKIPHPEDPSKLLDIYFQDGNGQMRIAEPGDFILLTAKAELSKGVGLSPLNPLPSQYVLDKDEVIITRTAVGKYNDIVKEAAAGHENVLVVDINAAFAELAKNGYRGLGEEYSSDYISGGLFSLDGVHTSSRGNAFVANIFIDRMNQEPGVNISRIALSQIPGMDAPIGISPAKGFNILEMDIPSNAFDGVMSLY